MENKEIKTDNDSTALYTVNPPIDPVTGVSKTSNPSQLDNENKQIQEFRERLQNFTPGRDYIVPYSPMYVGDLLEGISHSKYDEEDLVDALRSGEDIEDYRRKNQSQWDRLANATLNNAVIAGTTAISGTIGTALGVVEALVTLDFDKVWNNEITNAMSNIISKTNEALPIYHGEEYTNQSIWEKMGSGVFWADVVQNLGYTEGALIPSMGMSSVINKIGNKVVRFLVNDFVMTLSESAMEAVNDKNEILKQNLETASQDYYNKKNLLDMEIVLKKNKEQLKGQLQGIWVDRGDAGGYFIEPSDTDKALINDNIRQLDIYLDEIEKTKDSFRTKDPITDQVIRDESDDDIKANMEDKFKDTAKQINKDVKKIGNIVFGANVSILMLMNGAEFGKQLAGGWGTTQMLNNGVKRNVKDNLLGNAIKSIFSGDKEAIRYGYRTIASNITREMGSHIAKGTEELIEEGVQSFAAELPKNYTEWNTFLLSPFNPESIAGADIESAEALNTFAKAFDKTWEDKVNDPTWYEEMASGWITGGVTGFPTIRENMKGWRKFVPIRLENNLISGIRDAIKESKRAKTLSDKLNGIIDILANSNMTGEEIDKQLHLKKGLIISQTLKEEFSKAIKGNNKKAFLDVKTADVFNTLMTFYQAGEMETLKKMFSEETLTEDFVNDIIKQFPELYKGKSSVEVSEDLRKKFEEKREEIDQFSKQMDRANRQYSSFSHNAQSAFAYLNFILEDRQKRVKDLGEKIYNEIKKRNPDRQEFTEEEINTIIEDLREKFGEKSENKDKGQQEEQKKQEEGKGKKSDKKNKKKNKNNEVKKEYLTEKDLEDVRTFLNKNRSIFTSLDSFIKAVKGERSGIVLTALASIYDKEIQSNRQTKDTEYERDLEDYGKILDDIQFIYKQINEIHDDPSSVDKLIDKTVKKNIKDIKEKNQKKIIKKVKDIKNVSSLREILQGDEGEKIIEVIESSNDENMGNIKKILQRYKKIEAFKSKLFNILRPYFPDISNNDFEEFKTSFNELLNSKDDVDEIISEIKNSGELYIELAKMFGKNIDVIDEIKKKLDDIKNQVDDENDLREDAKEQTKDKKKNEEKKEEERTNEKEEKDEEKDINKTDEDAEKAKPSDKKEEEENNEDRDNKDNKDKEEEGSQKKEQGNEEQNKESYEKGGSIFLLGIFNINDDKAAKEEKESIDNQSEGKRKQVESDLNNPIDKQIINIIPCHLQGQEFPDYKKSTEASKERSRKAKERKWERIKQIYQALLKSIGKSYLKEKDLFSDDEIQAMIDKLLSEKIYLTSTEQEALRKIKTIKDFYNYFGYLNIYEYLKSKDVFNYVSTHTSELKDKEIYFMIDKTLSDDSKTPTILLAIKKSNGEYQVVGVLKSTLDIAQIYTDNYNSQNNFNISKDDTKVIYKTEYQIQCTKKEALIFTEDKTSLSELESKGKKVSAIAVITRGDPKIYYLDENDIDPESLRGKQPGCVYLFIDGTWCRADTSKFNSDSYNEKKNQSGTIQNSIQNALKDFFNSYQANFDNAATILKRVLSRYLYIKDIDKFYINKTEEGNELLIKYENNRQRVIDSNSIKDFNSFENVMIDFLISYLKVEYYNISALELSKNPGKYLEQISNSNLLSTHIRQDSGISYIVANKTVKDNRKGNKPSPEGGEGEGNKGKEGKKTKKEKSKTKTTLDIDDLDEIVSKEEGQEKKEQKQKEQDQAKEKEIEDLKKQRRKENELYEQDKEKYEREKFPYLGKPVIRKSTEIKKGDRGRRQIESLIGKLEGENDPIKQCTILAKIEQNLAAGAIISEEEYNLFEKTKYSLKDKGYTYSTLLLEKYSPGMKAEAKFTEDKTLIPYYDDGVGIGVITKVRKPIVYQNGRMVQMPEFDVTTHPKPESGNAQYRIVEEGVKEKKINLRRERRYLRNLFPELSVKIIDDFLNLNGRDAQGKYQKFAVTISKLAGRGTGFHEAFHYIVHEIMTDEEIKTLYEEAQKIYGSFETWNENRKKQEKQQKQLKNKGQEEEKEKTIDELKKEYETFLDESLAEDYRRYVEKERYGFFLSKVLIRVFRKIKRFIDSFTKNKKYIDTLFYNINRNKFRERIEEIDTILKDAPRDKAGRLLAPNGKVSNLTEKQYVQVRTKAFKKWYGDWENDPEHASKVLDENGEPLVVYHTVNASYDASFGVFNTEVEGKPTMIYHTDDREMSFSYTRNHKKYKTLESVKKRLSEIPDLLNKAREYRKSYESTTGPFDEETIINVLGYKSSSDPKWIKALEYQRNSADNNINSLLKEQEELEDIIKNPKKIEYVKVDFINMRNPLIIEGNGQNWDELSDNPSINNADIAKYNSEIDEYTKKVKDEISREMFSNRPEYAIMDLEDFISSDELDELQARIEKKVSEKYPEEKKELESTRSIEERYRNSKYDGIIFKNITDYGGGGPGFFVMPTPHNVFAVKNPNQVKSATENTGEFSTQDDSIYAREVDHSIVLNYMSVEIFKKNEQLINKQFHNLSKDQQIDMIKDFISVYYYYDTWDDTMNTVNILSNLAEDVNIYTQYFDKIFHIMLTNEEQEAIYREAIEKYKKEDFIKLLSNDFANYILIQNQMFQNTKNKFKSINNFFERLYNMVKLPKDGYSIINKLIYDISDEAINTSEMDEQSIILKNAPRNEYGQLLAPNGKVSKLTKADYIQVRTKAFKEQFGDWENPKVYEKEVESGITVNKDLDWVDGSNVIKKDNKYYYINDNNVKIEIAKEDYDNFIKGNDIILNKVTEKIKIKENNFSMVIDENGEPLVMYHRTNDNFTVFDKAFSRHGGFWFSKDPNYYINTKAKLKYAIPVFLNIKTPNVINHDTFLRAIDGDVSIEDLKDPKKDGWITLDEHIPEFNEDYYSSSIIFAMAVNPNQIISANGAMTTTEDIYHIREDSDFEWNNMKQDVKELLLQKGWNEMTWKYISDEEKQITLNCIIS